MCQLKYSAGRWIVQDDTGLELVNTTDKSLAEDYLDYMENYDGIHGSGYGRRYVLSRPQDPAGGGAMPYEIPSEASLLRSLCASLSWRRR